MPSQTSAVEQDLVLIGGGHSHAIALRMFAMHPCPGVRLTLITELPQTPYSGMLPGFVAGVYTFDEAHIDLRPLAQFAHCRLYIDRAIGLDLDRKHVICAHRPPVAFDYLSIDIGSTPGLNLVPGAAEHTIPAKPVFPFIQAWEQWLADLAVDPLRSRQVGIVGGGAGGVELTFNMQARVNRLYAAAGWGAAPVTFHLFQRSPELAPERNRRTRQLLTQLLRDRGVQLHLATTVVAVQPGVVCCDSGLTVACDRIFWVTSAAAPAWIQAAGLATDQRGFITVTDTLQSGSHPFVLAAGDIATMVNHPRPKAGVFAVRQGKPLFENLVRLLTGQSPRPFTPQRQFLTLIGTGDQAAIASRWQLAWRSPWVWQWKDHIDRKFMRQFEDLPPMAALPTRQPSTADPALMRCGGCGSKVGSTVLESVLQRLQSDQHSASTTAQANSAASHIAIGLSQPDDAAVFSVPAGQVMVQTVDYFRALLDDPYLFGQIATHHALNDLFAMGATPISGLAIAVVPDRLESKQAETLYQLLAGAVQVLQAADAQLIGGHSVWGTELAFGLTCNGIAPPDRLCRKGPLQPGQVLILTKAIGTGTLFAADQRHQAQGDWIATAIASMLQSNQAAAQLFATWPVPACTDITGFGILGHVGEMLRASPAIAIDLWLDALPILPGAQITTQQGIVSSLYPQNQRAVDWLANPTEFELHPAFPLLFDPQTAGGLLVAVVAEQAAAGLAQLHALGYDHAQIIGRVRSVPPSAPGRIHLQRP